MPTSLIKIFGFSGLTSRLPDSLVILADLLVIFMNFFLSVYVKAKPFCCTIKLFASRFRLTSIFQTFSHHTTPIHVPIATLPRQYNRRQSSYKLPTTVPLSTSLNSIYPQMHTPYIPLKWHYSPRTRAHRYRYHSSRFPHDTALLIIIDRALGGGYDSSIGVSTADNCVFARREIGLALASTRQFVVVELLNSAVAARFYK